MRPSRGRQRQGRCHRREGDDDDASHATGRVPRVASATAPSRTPIPPTTSAMIESVELPPPPSDEFASILGAGVSDDSGPLQSTTEPSEYVCRTENVYVLLESGLARNWKMESSPVGTLPPVQIT